MKLKNKFNALIGALAAFTASAVAHADENTGWMMDGSWMHSAGHMTGYNMWGMGWFGSLIGLSLWILILLGIVYLYQRITEE